VDRRDDRADVSRRSATADVAEFDLAKMSKPAFRLIATHGEAQGIRNV
jgi:hypothetical protein